MPAAGRIFLIFLALEGPPLSVHNNVSACRRQKIFGFERAPQPFSYIVHNTICACRRHNFFVLFEGPLSQFTIMYLSACRMQKILGLERAPSASLLDKVVYNIINACRRQKFFSFKGPFSLSLSSQ